MNMNLLQMLMGQQGGGQMGQQSGLQRLLAPEMLMAMGSGLMGNQGNMQNVGQAMANTVPIMAMQRQTQAQTADRNRTMDFFRANGPEYAAMIEAGMPVQEVWSQYTKQKFAKPENPYMSADGGVFNKDTGEWLNNPEAQTGGQGSMPTSIQEYERAQQDPNYADWLKNNKGRDSSLTTVDKKAIFEAEDVLPAVDGTLSALSRAKELNDKTYTGMTAGVRGWAGANVPGAGMLLDEEKSRATLEFNNLMTYESIKTMADTLKGATTDFELNKFVEILADPATPPDIRGRTIDRMMQLAQRKKQIAEDRVNKLRGGDYYDAPGAAPAAPGPAPAQGGGYRILGVE
jgi:hypothetical protein